VSTPGRSDGSPDLSLVAEALECGDPGNWHGRGLLEGSLTGLGASAVALTATYSARDPTVAPNTSSPRW
jgi:hypothetical protein